MSLSNIFQTPKPQMFSEYKIPRARTTNIHLQMTPPCVFVPQKLQCCMGITRILNQLTKVSQTHFSCSLMQLKQQILGQNNIISSQSDISVTCTYLDAFLPQLLLKHNYFLLLGYPLLSLVTSRWEDHVCCGCSPSAAT